MKDWRGRRILVLGLGASGRAALSLLEREGAILTAVDGREPEPPLDRQLMERGIVCLNPKEGVLRWEGDGAVASPGIPIRHPWIEALRSRGIPVWSELEIGWQRRKGARVLAITGSNGKSTLVRLCTGAIRRTGFSAQEAGNCGPPVSQVVLDSSPEWLVLEVSSFQLETVRDFRPDIGIWLNLHPNHLDRHGTIEHYAALKARMFAKQGVGDTAILHESVRRWAHDLAVRGMRCLWVGERAECDYRWESGWIVSRDGRERLDLRETYFDNPVLGPAAAAAAAVFASVSLPLEALIGEIRTFRPLPHRMEKVDEIGGVLFVNDSKATNLAALQAALWMMNRPVRLIVGGRLKETDLERAKELLQIKCRKVYSIGESASDFFSAWSGFLAVEKCDDLETAVRRSWAESRPGDVILLSPAAASFDQYGSFEQRGEHFRCIVETLKREALSLPKEARKK